MSKTQERGPGAPGSRFLPVGMLLNPTGGLLTAIIQNWRVIVFGILVAIIVYQNKMEWEVLSPFGLRTVPGVIQEYEDQLADAKEQVRVAQEQVTECDLSRERLKGAIEATNAQVEKWAALSNKLQLQHDHLSDELIRLNEQSEIQVQMILDGPIPQTCEGAIKLLRDSVVNGDLKW